mgnify:CR=1 FL=1
MFAFTDSMGPNMSVLSAECSPLVGPRVLNFASKFKVGEGGLSAIPMPTWVPEGALSGMLAPIVELGGEDCGISVDRSKRFCGVVGTILSEGKRKSLESDPEVGVDSNPATCITSPAQSYTRDAWLVKLPCVFDRQIKMTSYPRSLKTETAYAKSRSPVIKTMVAGAALSMAWQHMSTER